MRAVIFTLVLAAMTTFGARASDNSPPLSDGWYVDEGACPFEGCAYDRDWHAAVATDLYDGPRGTRRVATVSEGGTVRAMGGIVFTRPIPVTVVFANIIETYSYTRKSMYVRELHPGEQLYLLTYEGEGFNIAWLDGQRVSLSIVPMHDVSIHRFRSCETPSTDCWWAIPEDRRERDSEWWIRLRLPDGTEGWTREAENFSGVSLFE